MTQESNQCPASLLDRLVDQARIVIYNASSLLQYLACTPHSRAYLQSAQPPSLPLTTSAFSRQLSSQQQSTASPTAISTANISITSHSTCALTSSGQAAATSRKGPVRVPINASTQERSARLGPLQESARAVDRYHGCCEVNGVQGLEGGKAMLNQ